MWPSNKFCFKSHFYNEFFFPCNNVIVLLIPSLISKPLCHVASFACLQISARHRKTDLSNPLLTSLRIHFRLYVQFEGFFCYSGVCWGFQGRYDCVLSAHCSALRKFWTSAERMQVGNEALILNVLLRGSNYSVNVRFWSTKCYQTYGVVGWAT